MIYLTRKELEIIAQQLAAISVKDSDFEVVSELKYTDTVPIVQDGINKRISVDEFREELENGPRGYSSYEIAVMNGYEGTEEEWLASLKGDKGDFPDVNEDDLVIASETLKLADRPNTDGMGYVILRKNKTFAEQVTTANTVYEIRYDFDLNSTSITIPSGCVLKFDGGEIQNGTLTGNGTTIDADPIEIFSSVDITGTWNVPVIQSRWFNGSAVENCLAMNNANINTEILIDGDHSVVVPVNTTAGIIVKDNTIMRISGVVTKSENSATSVSSIFTLGNNVTVYGGTIDGNKSAFSSTNEYGHGISIEGANNVSILGVKIVNCHGDGVYVGDPQTISTEINIIGCEIDGCRRNGISVIYAQNLVVEDTYIHDVYATAPGAAIDVEPNYAYQYNKNIVVRNCRIENCLYCVSLSGTNVPIENTLVENVRASMTDYKNLVVCTNTKNTSFVNCYFSTTGARSTTYAITGSNANVPSFKNCTFEETGTSPASAGYIAISCEFENCKFDITSAFLANTLNGRFVNCKIVCAGGCQYGSTAGFELRGCEVTLNSDGMAIGGRSSSAPSRHIKIINCRLNITAQYYPIYGNYSDDVEISGCDMALAGDRTLVNFTSSNNVRVKNNVIIVGSNNTAVGFSSSTNCQAKENLISAADGITWSETKYSGINNKTAASNIPGDPFYFEGEQKMLMFNGTSVVNLDGTAL